MLDSLQFCTFLNLAVVLWLLGHFREKNELSSVRAEPAWKMTFLSPIIFVWKKARYRREHTFLDTHEATDEPTD